MTNALKIVTAEALELILGNTEERTVLVQPGSGKVMVNMNVVVDGEVKLHGICIPLNEISGKPVEGTMYKVDKLGNMTVLESKVPVDVPSNTVGCSMHQYRSGCKEQPMREKR